MRLLLCAFSAFHLLAANAWGACRVITPAGSGNNSGSDWSNACNGFSGNCSTSSGMVRGDTYYLGKGAYTSPGLSRANSGTTLITIKSPTSGDHCTDTGFVSGTHVGQADMAGSLFISSNYWRLDGVYGTEVPGTGKGTYGMKVHWNGGTSQMPIAVSGGGTGLIVRYMEVQGSNGSDTGCDVGIRILGYNQSPETNNVLIEHNYLYQSNNIIGLQVMNNITVQNNILSENWSTAGCHGENMALNGPSDLTIRYNRFINCVGTGCIATPSSLSLAISNMSIYGNVFYDDGRTGTCPGNFDCPGNGMIAIIDEVDVTTLKLYNNTVANWITGHTSSGNSLTFFETGSGGTITGLDVQNNLFYNNVPITLGNSGTCLSNSYYSTTRSSGACTGDQTGGSGNPFVNSVLDFNLVADTSAWSSLSSPYNVDPDGVTRTTSRGAYQFESGGSTAPTVTTTAASSITTTTASSGGNVTADGGASVTARGTCYATSLNPTTPCTSDGTGTGSFTSSLTGLSVSTLYHIRAFATNSVGTSYGSDLTFTTSAAATPVSRISGKSTIGGKTVIK